MASGLTASVGKGGTNRQHDVLVVQSYLNNWIMFGALKGRASVLTSGQCDTAMIEAIRLFQSVVIGMSSPDRRIDPKGRTFRRLSGQVTQLTAADLRKVNWKRNQPIFFQLELLLVENFPFLTELGYGKRWSGMGAYVNRTTRSGGVSHHAEGRAVDIYLSAFKSAERRLGDGLFELFIANGRALGVDHVIWNHRIWSWERGGPRPYTNRQNGPHTDHVHVSFTRAASQQQPDILSKLIPALRRKLDAEEISLMRRLEGVDPHDFQSPYD